MAGLLGGHAMPRNPVELAVHQRDELLERRVIAVRPGLEQRRYIGRSHRTGRILSDLVAPDLACMVYLATGATA